MNFPLQLNKENCIQCGACEGACGYDALRMDEYPVINADNCRLCSACADACPANALRLEIVPANGKTPRQANGIWVFAEVQQGEISPVVFELLGIAAHLAEQQPQPISAVLTGNNCSGMIPELFAYGAQRVYVAEDPRLKNPLDDRHASVLTALTNRYQPNILLIGATHFGRGVSARVAAQLNTGLTADCTELSIDGATGNLLQRRPAFGGNLLATIVTPNHRPQMASVRPQVMKALAPQYEKQGEVIRCDLSDIRIDTRVELLSSEVITSASSLADAPVIVAGGRGMQHRKHIPLLYKLADRLGGTVAGSRAAVEAGWIPFEQQVGQTGKTVSPHLYIACGISGQIQHTAGITGADTVIAINNDSEASIFNCATYGLVGDVNEILPRLIKALE